MSSASALLAAAVCSSLFVRKHRRRRKKRGVKESKKRAMLAAERLDRAEDRAATETAPFIIGLAGASGSGKTSLVNLLVEQLGEDRVGIISSDCYYHGLPHGTDPLLYNWDEPGALDFSLLTQHLQELRAGRAIEVPQYCFVTHKRLPSSTTLADKDVILVEGLFVLFMEQLREQMDLCVFINEEPDLCLARRISRDVSERGRDVAGILTQYERFVKPAMGTYILPSMVHADLIIPRAKYNLRAQALLISTLHSRLAARAKARARAAAAIAAAAAEEEAAATAKAERSVS